MIAEEHCTPVKRLLRENISLYEIYRAVGFGIKWLMHFMGKCFTATPAHLHIQPMGSPTAVTLHRLETEADEMCRFVGKKTNKQWIWLAMDTRTRQVIACHVGDRSRKSAGQLWGDVPAAYREQAGLYTDCYEVYTGVIPAA